MSAVWFTDDELAERQHAIRAYLDRKPSEDAEFTLRVIAQLRGCMRVERAVQRVVADYSYSKTLPTLAVVRALRDEGRRD